MDTSHLGPFSSLRCRSFHFVVFGFIVVVGWCACSSETCRGGQLMVSKILFSEKFHVSHHLLFSQLFRFRGLHPVPLSSLFTRVYPILKSPLPSLHIVILPHSQIHTSLNNLPSPPSHLKPQHSSTSSHLLAQRELAYDMTAAV